ncbi:MAG: PriCT-2 domain-containing protein [Flammeovirgaceae bacterium]|nr:PriCT-2 domain-containing protein [Flammeovirgaceae bacterium]
MQTNNSFEAPDTDTEEVEKIIRQIEANQIDIATAYSDWRDIGFAFADAFNESGRDYFHRVSSFYADSFSSECDKQFNTCLKSKGQGITLKTFSSEQRQPVSILVSSSCWGEIC